MTSLTVFWEKRWLQNSVWNCLTFNTIVILFNNFNLKLSLNLNRIGRGKKQQHTFLSLPSSCRKGEKKLDILHLMCLRLLCTASAVPFFIRVLYLRPLSHHFLSGLHSTGKFIYSKVSIIRPCHSRLLEFEKKDSAGCLIETFSKHTNQDKKCY